MKKISFILISAVFVVLGLYSLGYSERGIKIQERRFALVIGNGSYKSSPLRNPTNDAHDMALVLKTLGFEVTHLQDAEHRAMERAIRKFGKQLRNGGAGLFYFAGHGIQVNGRNYLIPVDAEIETESDVKFEAVDAGRVVGKMEDAGNDLNIVILDACRDNPFSPSFRTSNQGLARMDAPKGSLIAYATAPGSIAADGEGRNGIYTKYLLKNLITRGLIVEQILKKVRVEVLKETSNKQIPWESSSLTGNFYFNPVKSKMKPSIIEPQQTLKTTQQEGYSEKYEMLFWDSIKESNDAEPFEAYLNKFPNGVFAELARMNIKKYSQQIEEKPTSKSNAERPKIKEDKPKLAYIPKPVAKPKISLRKEPKFMDQSSIKEMLHRYSFFDKSLNPKGSFINNFVEHDAGTVSDQVTSLMWQKSGSRTSLHYNRIKKYIRELNDKKFAGYSDWRLPTVDELASLINRDKVNGVYLAPLFDNKNYRCWTVDSRDSRADGSFGYYVVWIINFQYGNVDRSNWSRKGSHSHTFYTKDVYNFVKAVRTIE